MGRQGPTGASLYLQSDSWELTHGSSRDAVPLHLQCRGRTPGAWVYPETWFSQLDSDQSSSSHIFWGPKSEFPKSPTMGRGPFAIFHSRNRAEGEHLCP